MKSMMIAVVLVASFVVSMSAKSDDYIYIDMMPQVVAGPITCKILGQREAKYFYMVKTMEDELAKFKPIVNMMGTSDRDQFLAEVNMLVSMHLNSDAMAPHCINLLSTIKTTNEAFKKE